MKEVISELKELRIRLSTIDERLSTITSSIDAANQEDLDETYKLIEEELLEVRKLESLLLAKKVQIMEKKIIK